MKRKQKKTRTLPTGYGSTDGRKNSGLRLFYSVVCVFASIRVYAGEPKLRRKTTQLQFQSHRQRRNCKSAISNSLRMSAFPCFRFCKSIRRAAKTAQENDTSAIYAAQGRKQLQICNLRDGTKQSPFYWTAFMLQFGYKQKMRCFVSTANAREFL